jgi:short-subunit dehydrogenase involved in D-alanine esterification of teichoic acids
MPGIDLSKSVFITGATAGIGRALAYKIKALPSKPQVIVAGRRQDRLDELAKDGFETYKMDVGSDRATLKKDVETLLARYPDVGFLNGILPD